jgi:hypothetical protein
MYRGTVEAAYQCPAPAETDHRTGPPRECPPRPGCGRRAAAAPQSQGGRGVSSAAFCADGQCHFAPPSFAGEEQCLTQTCAVFRRSRSSRPVQVRVRAKLSMDGPRHALGNDAAPPWSARPARSVQCRLAAGARCRRGSSSRNHVLIMVTSTTDSSFNAFQS